MVTHPKTKDVFLAYGDDIVKVSLNTKKVSTVFQLGRTINSIAFDSQGQMYICGTTGLYKIYIANNPNVVHKLKIMFRPNITKRITAIFYHNHKLYIGLTNGIVSMVPHDGNSGIEYSPGEL
mmetsp:Transcript_20865/g.23241  ORF Transcript_20865/g.23241 Transcript_20865/m.23241 type:complete len:122 (+) Transcript_20865:301-666(+)